MHAIGILLAVLSGLCTLAFLIPRPVELLALAALCLMSLIIEAVRRLVRNVSARARRR